MRKRIYPQPLDVTDYEKIGALKKLGARCDIQSACVVISFSEKPEWMTADEWAKNYIMGEPDREADERTAHGMMFPIGMIRKPRKKKAALGGGEIE